MKATPTTDHHHRRPAASEWEELLHPVEGGFPPGDDVTGSVGRDPFDADADIEADRRSERRLIEQALFALLFVAALVAVGLLAA